VPEAGVLHGRRRRPPAVQITAQPLAAGRLPHSKLDIIDAGHFTWEDAADQYAALVINWWAGGYAPLDLRQHRDPVHTSMHGQATYGPKETANCRPTQ
jgi:hypothetical protein